ncbi:OLC1v1013948C1 [Oldenlandia corymbosa var. corymbosa]|uniref:OLC1v1013948C1 n=1 Tax=Oldenlandia corymbosa var. corymbosa TaxID=529605 RepID=A0AAV1DZL2_OLDCO|nr:OLC1v1013948C1 [Oldenlandia corymbosa var. corymbosa]
MKTAFFVVFLVYLFVSDPPFSSAAEAPKPVLDTAKKSVRTGTRYFIFSVFPRTGGLTLESLEKPCPLSIVQEDNLGYSVSFSPINPKKGVVRVSTDLNVEFNVPTNCSSSTWWNIDISPSTGNYFLSTGGSQGNPGPNTVRNWFKIEQDGQQQTGGNLYKFVYCPTFSKTTCKNVGIVVQNGKRRLGLTNVPLQFVLKQSEMV